MYICDGSDYYKAVRINLKGIGRSKSREETNGGYVQDQQLCTAIDSVHQVLLRCSDDDNSKIWTIK